MTAYLGDKPVSIGGVKATEAVAGKVLRDKTMSGDGFHEPLGVDTNVMATMEYVHNREEAIREDMVDLDKVYTKEEVSEKLESYLPLTGGGLLGKVHFDIGGTAGKNTPLIGVKTADGTVPLIGAKTDDNGVLRDIAVIPKLLSETLQASQIVSNFIGSASTPVTRIHAKKIGTGLIGRLLTIPDGPGTIARLEDIPDVYTKTEVDEKFKALPKPIDAYTKAEVDAKLSSVYKFKGSVANINALPTSAAVGDTYNVEDTGANYAWDGSKWDKLSDTVDLSDYATVDYVDNLGFDLVEHIGDETTKRIANDNQLQKNILVLRDMLNEKDENEEFIQLTTEAQTAIPAINELNEKKASKEDLAGYLPLSGGTVSGELSLEGAGDRPTFLTLKNTEYNESFHLGVNYVGQLVFSFGSYSLVLSNNGSIQSTGYDRQLGGKYFPWKNVFAEKLNAGRQNDVDSGDLIVPTEGGTLARLEDLEGLGGDSLPDQTGNAGKFLMTDGTTTSWGGDDLIKNTAKALYRDDTIRIGRPAPTSGSDVASAYISITGKQGSCTSGAVAIGSVAKAAAANSIAIGRWTQTTGARSIVLDASGSATNKNTEADVFVIGNGNGFFVMMDANGNVPLERLTYVTDQIGDISTALAAILGE